MSIPPFLDRLGTEARRDILKSASSERFRRGEFVLTQKEETGDVFFLITGLARATMFSAEGKIVAYRDMQAGDIFGELSAIDEEPRSASVVAVNDIEVARLSRIRFIRLLREEWDLNWALLTYLVGQSRIMTGRIFEFSTMLVRDRLVEELIRMGEAVADGEGYATIAPGPTHFDLAARISTHREAVSREMSRLSKQKMITKRPKGALWIDLAKLRESQNR